MRFPKQWELWVVRFNYKEGHGYKYRPILVLLCEQDKVYSAMITSSHAMFEKSSTIPLQDWTKEGLKKPSFVRLDRIAWLPREYFATDKRIGSISENDKMAIEAALQSLAKTRK